MFNQKSLFPKALCPQNDRDRDDVLVLQGGLASLLLGAALPAAGIQAAACTIRLGQHNVSREDLCHFPNSFFSRPSHVWYLGSRFEVSLWMAGY